MFAIGFEQRGAARGEIIIGAHRERFDLDLSVWSREDYKASWQRACADVLQRGYGRFLVVVSEPGGRGWTAWVCRTDGNDARFFKAFLLGSLTRDFASPEEAETLEDDYAERNDNDPSLKTYVCTLADVANFEARLRGAMLS